MPVRVNLFAWAAHQMESSASEGIDLPTKGNLRDPPR